MGHLSNFENQAQSRRPWLDDSVCTISLKYKLCAWKSLGVGKVCFRLPFLNCWTVRRFWKQSNITQGIIPNLRLCLCTIYIHLHIHLYICARALVLLTGNRNFTCKDSFPKYFCLRLFSSIKFKTRGVGEYYTLWIFPVSNLLAVRLWLRLPVQTMTNPLGHLIIV